ncbi:MAG: hypothetical protein HYX27_17185 [Acidobacteria bacterium]|nr:hypothetical protein [Acidobacteriota bacterium]
MEPGGTSDPEFLKLHDGVAKRVSVKANRSEQVTLVQVPVKATKAR